MLPDGHRIVRKEADLQLGRVTCLTSDLRVFLDDYILCEDPVADYLSRFSGLSREDLKRVKREQAEQRNALYKKLKPLQAKYAEKEKALEEVLSRHDEVEKLLADPAVYADGAKATSLLKEFHELEESSEKGLEELGELEAQITELEAQRAALSLDGGE